MLDVAECSAMLEMQHSDRCKIKINHFGKYLQCNYQF